MSAPISGTHDAAFDAVADAFVANFAERGEVGAAVTVIVDGRTVVELFGGWTDEQHTLPWQHDTLVNFYSLGKGLLALLALQLVDTGRVDLDQTISSVWPEFAAGGKHTATIRHALTHRAGVPAIRQRLCNDDLWDWQRMTTALAATEAWWVPGERFAYHTNTYGHLIGEIIHRLTGEMPGARLRRVADEIGADLWWGLPTTQQHRCADVIWAPSNPMPDTIDFDALHDDALMVALAHFNPPGYSSNRVVNTTEWRAAQVPSTNGHGTATGVARVYAALLKPGRLLSATLLAEATRPQVTAVCPILGEETTFGLGFKPTTRRRPLGPNTHSFGHFGTGGSLGFADPDAGVAFGYVMNHVIPRWQSTRNRALIDAVYASL